ncbi:DUF2147 domain-containing protein [Tardiphaga sp. 841_E9_N1_2]|uniref:DUF2147 domain-containing protein n=1 Tax=Tardiphaga sp. 841_E9_N1_2 TaxID=3240762 RepID=UPI003F258E99
MRQMTLVSRIVVRAVIAVSQMALVGPVAAAPADPSGTWLTEDGRARIRIERCGSKLEQICGYIVWATEPNDANGQPLKDLNNPDKTKQSRPILGHQLIMGLKLNPAGRFEGQIYNAENGKSYEISLWREAIDLKVKGCMMSIFCATQTWIQTTNAVPGQLVGMTGDPNGPKADKEWMQTTQAKPATATRASK